MTPEELLRSPWWRLRNSVWILIPFLSLGTLTWVAYIWKAAQTRRMSFIVSAALYGFLFLGLIFVSAQTDDAGAPYHSLAVAALTWIAVLTWISGTVQALLMNTSWLRWRAQDEVDTYTNAEAAYQAHLALLADPDAVATAPARQNRPTPSLPWNTDRPPPGANTRPNDTSHE